MPDKIWQKYLICWINPANIDFFAGKNSVLEKGEASINENPRFLTLKMDSLAKKNDCTGCLFFSSGILIPELKELEAWDEKKSLLFEKEVLGMYVSGHPLLEHAGEIEEFTSVDFSDSLSLKKNEVVTVGGMVTKITKKYDRRNRAMAFFEMDCFGGTVEVIAFSDCFEKYENLIEEDEVIFINGKMADDTNFSDLKVMADKIVSVENAREYFSRKLIINLSSQNVSPEDIEDLYEFSRRFPGDCNLLFHLSNPNPALSKPVTVLAHNIKISTDKNFIKQLRDKYGKENIRVE